MEIRQGHRPHRIYQPTLTQVRDDTPALLVNRLLCPKLYHISDLIIHHLGEAYWQQPSGKYERITEFVVGVSWDLTESQGSS